MAIVLDWADTISDEELRVASVKWRSAPKYMTLLHCALRAACFPLARRILSVTNGQAANIVTGCSNQPKSWSCLHIVCEAAVPDVLASGHSGIPPISVADMIEELIPFMGRAEIAWKIKGGS